MNFGATEAIQSMAELLDNVPEYAIETETIPDLDTVQPVNKVMCCQHPPLYLALCRQNQFAPKISHQWIQSRPQGSSLPHPKVAAT